MPADQSTPVRRQPHRLPALMAAATLATLLAACGGGDDDESRAASALGATGLQRAAVGVEPGTQAPER